MGKREEDDGLRSVMTFNKRSDADDFILALPKILKELNLDYRFDTVWAPRIITERWRRGHDAKIAGTFFEVLMRDKFAGAAPPNITTADIAEAWHRVKRQENLPRLEQQAPEPEPESAMTAFGRTQDIKEWAKVFRTKPSTIRRYMEECGDLESALSQIALKKSA